MGNENCNKIIKQSTKYFESICHLVEEEMYIPYTEFVRPRKPREVVFAVGGWSGLYPTWVIETYDPRADRWINVLLFSILINNSLKKKFVNNTIFFI